MGLLGAPCMKPLPLRKTWRLCGRSWSHSIRMCMPMFAGLCTRSMALNTSTWRGPFLLICWVSKKEVLVFQHLRSNPHLSQCFTMEFKGFQQSSSNSHFVWKHTPIDILSLAVDAFGFRQDLICFQRCQALDRVWQFHTVRDWTDCHSQMSEQRTNFLGAEIYECGLLSFQGTCGRRHGLE